jgi:NADH-quinone oxidoreductase subunit L
MVTAGVYMMGRLHFVFGAAPEAVLHAVAWIASATALLAGLIAVVQNDIKKVLAYSTVSQLGFMFAGMATAEFGTGLFHVVTHAFFKGLLFLGAGSVIHGLHEEQDLHKMGGLRREMPRTWITFLAGAAALSGLPLFSGFFSKDEILAQTLAQGGIYRLLWLVGLLTAGLTAFYTWRMVALCFYGKGRYDHHHVHPHESGPSMVVPLLVLALLSLGGGLLGLPEVFHLPHVLNGWMAEVVRPGRALVAAHHGGHLLHVSHALEWGLLALGSVVALGCAMLGFQTYRHGPRADLRWSERRPKLQGFLARAWAVDEGYGRWIVGPLRILAFVVSVVVDAFAIDGLVNGAAALARTSAERSRALADGRLSSYALWIGGGSALLVSLWMWA